MHLLVIGVALLVAGYLIRDAEPAQEKSGFPANPRGSFGSFERIIIIGLPLSGKTTLAKKLTKDCPRVLYFDPCRDYATMRGVREVSAEELIDDPMILNEPTFRIAVVPDEPENEVDDVCRIARAAGDLIIVFDEVGDYNKGKAGEALKRMARNGRHDGIVSIYVSQVAVDIPKTVRRIATRVYSFRQVHPEDIEALDEIYGPAFAAKVANAGEHEVSTWQMSLASSQPSSMAGGPGRHEG